jgi:Meiotically up-regulated gene 113
MRVIYFIQAGRYGPVKIGISKNPRKRLRALQVPNPKPLTLLGVMEGDSDTEKEVHREFRNSRIRGEWFSISPELLRFIDSECDPGLLSSII